MDPLTELYTLARRLGVVIPEYNIEIGVKLVLTDWFNHIPEPLQSILLQVDVLDQHVLRQLVAMMSVEQAGVLTVLLYFGGEVEYLIDYDRERDPTILVDSLPAGVAQKHYIQIRAN